MRRELAWYTYSTVVGVALLCVGLSTGDYAGYKRGHQQGYDAGSMYQLDVEIRQRAVDRELLQRAGLCTYSRLICVKSDRERARGK